MFFPLIAFDGHNPATKTAWGAVVNPRISRVSSYPINSCRFFAPLNLSNATFAWRFKQTQNWQASVQMISVDFSLDLDLRSKHNPLNWSISTYQQNICFWLDHLPPTTTFLLGCYSSSFFKQKSLAEVSGLVGTMDNAWLKFHDEKCSDSTKLLSLSRFRKIRRAWWLVDENVWNGPIFKKIGVSHVYVRSCVQYLLCISCVFYLHVYNFLFAILLLIFAFDLKVRKLGPGSWTWRDYQTHQVRNV